jgi:prefoldin subunit 5
MIEQLTTGMILEFVILVSGGIGAWVKINQQVMVLKSRIVNLEKKEESMDKKLDLLMDAVQELKILLAKSGMT